MLQLRERLQREVPRQQTPDKAQGHCPSVGRYQPGLVTIPRGKQVSLIQLMQQSGISLLSVTMEVKCFNFMLKCQQKLILIGSCRLSFDIHLNNLDDFETVGGSFNQVQ